MKVAGNPCILLFDTIFLKWEGKFNRKLFHDSLLGIIVLMVVAYEMIGDPIPVWRFRVRLSLVPLKWRGDQGDPNLNN